MDTTTLIETNRLLDHPFYRRWEEGKLEEGELSSYAAQYRYFEAQLPEFLTALSALVVDRDAQALVDANLADEVDGPETHLALFDRFAKAVDAPDEALSPAMATLVNTYKEAIANKDSSFALGVLAGYEVQAAEVAATKGEGLAAHYGVTGEGLSFWNLHAEVEQDHAAWTLSASASCNTEQFIKGARASSSAWWGFLDEREALHAA